MRLTVAIRVVDYVGNRFIRAQIEGEPDRMCKCCIVAEFSEP
jgi:hypothetical protein